jgi:hypothetical protein
MQTVGKAAIPHRSRSSLLVNACSLDTSLRFRAASKGLISHFDWIRPIKFELVAACVGE